MTGSGVLPAAEAQPAIIMPTSPRVVIVVAVRMYETRHHPVVTITTEEATDA